MYKRKTGTKEKEKRLKLFPKSTESSHTEKLQSRKSYPFPIKNTGRATEKNDPA